MKKSEIFDILVNKVCDVCEVRMDTLIHGSNDNIIIINDKVDAIIKMLSYDEQKEQDNASPMTDGKQ